MRAAGYRDDPASLLAAVGALRRLIEGGARELDANAVRAIGSELNLLAGHPRATLLVQGIASDPWPESATAYVDWVELFDGDEANARRQLLNPDGWNAQLKPELVAAVDQIKRTRMTDVDVLGAMRLSTGLLVGQQLSEVAGFTVAMNRKEGLWSSTSQRHEFLLDRKTIEIDAGDEIAVAISISQPITDDVIAYIEAEQLPIATLYSYNPPDGPSREAIPTVEHGAGAAAAISAVLRADTRGHRGPLHLFLAAPLPVAVLIGHLWNRMPETQLYEDRGAGGGYLPTFTL